MMKIDERLIQLETERSLLEKKRKELAEEERRMLRVRKIYPDVFMSKLADGTPCFMSHTVKAPSMVELDKAGTIKTFITVSSSINMTQFRWAEKAAGEVVYGSEPIYVSPKLLAGLLKKIPQRELMRAVASIRG